MKFNIEYLPHTDIWMTPSQFEAIMEGQKCSHCDKKAKWVPKYERGIGYCDQHYPYNNLDQEEKEPYDS